MFRRLGKRLRIPLAHSPRDMPAGPSTASPFPWSGLPTHAASFYDGFEGHSPLSGTPCPGGGLCSPTTPTTLKSPQTHGYGGGSMCAPSAGSGSNPPHAEKPADRHRLSVFTPQIATPSLAAWFEAAPTPGTGISGPEEFCSSPVDDLALLEKNFGELTAPTTEEFDYDEDSLASDMAVNSVPSVVSPRTSTKSDGEPSAGTTTHWVSSLLEHQILPTPTALGCLLSLGVPEQQISVEDTLQTEEMGEDASDLSDEDAQVLSSLLTIPTPHPSMVRSGPGSIRASRKRALHFVYSEEDLEDRNDTRRRRWGSPRESTCTASTSESETSDDDEDDDEGAQIVRQTRPHCSNSIMGLERSSSICFLRDAPDGSHLHLHQQDPLAGEWYLSSLGPRRGDFL